MLLGVPNFSEGRDERTVESISAAFARGAAVLDVHSDPDHNRSVVTLAAPAESLAGALVHGARACVEAIDVTKHEGAHPRIGALDVCPVVWTAADRREPAEAQAREVGARVAAELDVPVFLYGDLASRAVRRERSFFRRGGLVELSRRMASGELVPDHGPRRPHPTAGVTLVTARPPLAAFNLEVHGIDADAARDVAARLRESGGGPPGVRALAIELRGGGQQVTTNVHDPSAVRLAEVTRRVEELVGPRGGRVIAAEIVGLVPAAALEGFPDDVPIRGFDPARHVIERRLN